MGNVATAGATRSTGRASLAMGLSVMLGAAAVVSCSNLALDPRAEVIHARFDPDDRTIPMPNDALRDPEAGRLELPNDEPDELAKLSPAELEFYDYLETLDGWSTLMSATVELTGAIDPRSADDKTIEVWRWSGVPTRVNDVRIGVSADAKKITIDPPPAGWTRGARYVVLMRGGPKGVVGARGEPVECDAAFYFLRQTEPLDTEAHQHAFPGNTRAERADNARKLEENRVRLAPVFDRFETEHKTPRAEVAALWDFTVTTRTELAMDKPSQRLPLPIDLMIVPKTGHIEAPIAPWDSPLEAEAKTRLVEMTGFGLSANLLFELTAPMDTKTVNASSVRLYRLGDGAPTLVPADVKLLPNLMHVVITPRPQRLAEGTTYAVVVTKAVRDAQGSPVMAMAPGHFLKALAPVFADGHSLVKGVEASDAERVELGRAALAPALAGLGRDDVLGAWTFTTAKVKAPLIESRKTAERLAVPADPAGLRHLSPLEAVAEFPLGITALGNVGDVVYGTIKSPVFLDRLTRSFRQDGGHELQDIDFSMTVPKNLPAGKPVPVVIFGHALVTERRFVLAVGDALAARGFVAISIDFPYHGKRTVCAKGGPISVVNPFNGELSSLEPCQFGTTCNDEGRCVDAQGLGNKLATFPGINLPVASGAVFQDVNHIAATRDHFVQGLIDLGALDRSLRIGAWAAVIGRPVDTTRIYYAGQSLGGIMGAIFLASDPDIPRAVLNVPGADLVDMFDDSIFFGPQMDALFTREKVARDSFRGERMTNVARWFMDMVDPQSFGRYQKTATLIQMATLDGIIPNSSTKILEEVTGAKRRDYIAEHGFLAIPIELEYGRGTQDLAKWLAGEVLP